MKLQVTFVLSLLLAIVAFAGCYTQLGYYASSDFDREHHKHDRGLAKEGAEHDSEIESEELEPEHTDAEKSEGYYGRRKYTHRETYVYPRGYSGSYWVPYPLYSHRYYMPAYHSYPWFYRYGYYYGYSPYYHYYRGYSPYRNVYRRYYGYGGSRYTPHSRRTYDRRDWRPENRRSRSSRSVTSPKSRSERLQRRIRNRNEK